MSTLTQFTGSGIKSVQRGTVVINSASSVGNATVSAVDTAKSLVALLGFSVNSSLAADPIDWAPRVALTSTTNITATRGQATVGPAITVSWELVEYY